jgi:hypothetical protein
MPRARPLVFVLLSTIIAACSAAPTSPQQPRSRVTQKAVQDNIPCDSIARSGYGLPNGHC